MSDKNEIIEVIVMHEDGWTELNATDWTVLPDEGLSVRVSLGDGRYANAQFARGYWQSIVPVAEGVDA